MKQLLYNSRINKQSQASAPRAAQPPAHSYRAEKPRKGRTLELLPEGLTCRCSSACRPKSHICATTESIRGPTTVPDVHNFESHGSPVPFEHSLTGMPQDSAAHPALVVFSGGTAFNSVAGHLQQLTTRTAHVLPVSDDGGSTAEIVRVLGGPAVGDIRSRCLRLADDSGAEARAVRRLLAHRLSEGCAEAAKAEWYGIVEGEHALWHGVSEPYKHTIRAFLVHFHAQILRHSTERFVFRNGSVGNFFFAGARLFLASLEAAIFLFSRVARIPEGSLVLPAICTEERINLGAELANGSVIRGQNEISHPSAPESPGPISVVKHGVAPPLPAPIQRIFYLSYEGTAREHEVCPPPNPRLMVQLAAADAIVYGMGSLFTSICPSLVLQGVGELIAARTVPKVVLLNGSHDRETSARRGGAGPMTAADIVEALQDSLNRRYAPRGGNMALPVSAYITDLLVPRGGAIAVDRPQLLGLGLRRIWEVDAYRDADGVCAFNPAALVDIIQQIVLGPAEV